MSLNALSLDLDPKKKKLRFPLVAVVTLSLCILSLCTNNPSLRPRCYQSVQVCKRRCRRPQCLADRSTRSQRVHDSQHSPAWPPYRPRSGHELLMAPDFPCSQRSPHFTFPEYSRRLVPSSIPHVRRRRMQSSSRCATVCLILSRAGARAFSWDGSFVKLTEDPVERDHRHLRSGKASFSICQGSPSPITATAFCHLRCCACFFELDGPSRVHPSIPLVKLTW